MSHIDDEAAFAIATNVQGFALGQSEITNYRTLGSVAANNFQKPHCRRGLAQNPLCLLHNSHHVHKDICFCLFDRSNLKYARQKTIYRKTVHQFSIE